MSQQSIIPRLIPRGISDKIHHLFASNILGAHYNYNRQYRQITGEFAPIPAPRHPSCPLPDDDDVALARTMRLNKAPTTDALRRLSTGTTDSMHVLTLDKHINERLRRMDQQPHAIRLHPAAVKLLEDKRCIVGGYYYFGDLPIPVERDERLKVNHPEIVFRLAS